MTPAIPDRNLLYAILAVQLRLVGPDALIAAMAAWASDRGRPLGQILMDRGALSEADHATVEQALRGLSEAREDAGSCVTELDPADLPSLLTPPGPEGATEITSIRAQVDTVAARDDVADLQATHAWTEVPLDGLASPAAPGPAGAGGARFRVVKSHAAGGLGEVFLAWDAELDRNVALKQIRPEYLTSERARERFLREARINGNLEHPGIVPVYGLGADAEGRPYYAMRFVQGENLKDAADRFHAEAPSLDTPAWTLRLRQLLRRFLAICDAIDYSHGRGVLHRDLKPANILLGKHGETLIIDWGLAKVIGRNEGGSGVEPSGEDAVAPHPGGSQMSTLAGETLGSPPYMSPEQARGAHDELEPASDIYSLGATLYTVLTGRPPIGSGTTKDVLARVRQGAIDPPLRANPRTPPALAAICLKAMHLEPSGRYPSARALAEDIERWLDDLPVAVFDDPPSTRLLRWSRRHRSFVAASLALLLASVVGLAGFAVVVRAQKARAVAARIETDLALEKETIARCQAKEHLQVGLDVVAQLVKFADGRLITGMPPSERRGFLQAASAFLARFREREPGELSIQVQTAQVARRVANLHRLTGQFDQAARFYEEAIRSFENLVARSPSPAYADLLAETLLDQGDCDLVRGRVNDAEARFRKAIDLARRNTETAAGETMYRRTLGRALARLGSARLLLRGPDAAELERQALERIAPLADAALPTVRDEILQDHVLPLTDQIEWVQARYTLAEALEASGDRAGAEDQLRRARARTEELVERLRGLRLGDVDFVHAWVGIRLARLLSGGGDGDEASRLLDDSIGRLAPSSAQNEEVPQNRAALADARVALASLCERRGEYDRARKEAEAARDALTSLVRDHPDVPDYAALQAEALALLGGLALRRDPDAAPEAREFFREAVRLQTLASQASPENPSLRERIATYRARLDDRGPAPE